MNKGVFEAVGFIGFLEYLDGIMPEVTEAQERLDEEKTAGVLSKGDGKYKAGDVIKIKEWGDMEKEFGLNDWGNIDVPGGLTFAQSMKCLCGKDFEITRVDDDGDYEIKDEVFFITDAMIQHENTTEKQEYMCFAEGGNIPTYKHSTIEDAKKEAQRIADKEKRSVAIVQLEGVIHPTFTIHLGEGRVATVSKARARKILKTLKELLK